MAKYERKAMRIICFAHKDCANIENTSSGYCYDGFAVICDPVRKEVYQAVRRCKQAHIKVKMLTGDNLLTATAIAKELNLITSESECVTATELEKLSEEQLIEKLKSVSVIARSTPITKLKVVKALKRAGEVVAVTGDGINDAPAIKQADVGFAMGITGSEITKEASDVILLNDSFSTVVKAIEFGRSVYRNLQRFILFQLTVNLSAVMLIMISLLLGFSAPFNTLQLLWINIIMDGPPALTLGLESASNSLLKRKPISKSQGIVSGKMLARILFNGIYVGVIMLLEYSTDFLGVGGGQMSGVIFTLFIFFQLFNAFNSRELGAESIFKGIGKNKIMVLTFLSVLILHIFIVQVCPSLFGITALNLSSWLKCVLISSSIVVMSEIYKAIYRAIKMDKKGAI
jgi:Ca2+-transporting ATPase